MEAIVGWESPWVMTMNAPDHEAKEIVRSYLFNEFGRPGICS